jgi:hypothetical protein
LNHFFQEVLAVDKEEMSQPFVKIENKKLQLKAKLNFAKLGDVKVVSILGKARISPKKNFIILENGKS